MIAIYAVCIVLGVIGIFTWITMGLVSSSWGDKKHLDPEQRFGAKGRYVVAGLSGFGLAGMSASFGGWNDGLAIVAALGGAAGAIAAAIYLGFEEDPDGDTA
ncbi:MAG: hypothetical protein QNL12_06485 [Acidimicrobiia bacterium]|nr:hypothetical protein [Acidimicrobiia bacterium]MDX2466941.1 hypothetical protein [Acidimicrobiia bacterium]